MTLTRSTRATFSFEVCITRSDIMVYLHVQCFCWLGHHLGIARTVSRHSLVPMFCILLSVKQMTLTYQHFFIWYELTLEQSISNIAISLKFVQLKLLVGKIPLIFFSNPVFCINLIVICKARWARRKKTGKKISQIKWPKYQKPKDENMEWTKHLQSKNRAGVLKVL